VSDPGGSAAEESIAAATGKLTDNASATLAGNEPPEKFDRPQGAGPAKSRGMSPGAYEPDSSTNDPRFRATIGQASGAIGTDQEASSVAVGLGWPYGSPNPEPTATGLGWPDAVDEASPVTPGHKTVGPPSRASTNRPDSAGNDAVKDFVQESSLEDSTLASGKDEEIQVSQESSVDRVDPATFGPHPAPGSHTVVTAAEFASHSPLLDDTTPLARAAAHRLLVTEGVQLAEPLPQPDRTRVVVVANQKGGVGKTTSAVNIAAALAQHGLRVLVVDLDPQGNASTAVSLDHSEGTAGVYEVVVEGAPMAGVVSECAEIPGLFAVPASIDLAGAEIELVSLVARESRLRKALDLYLHEQEAAGNRFDFVFIDCPPSLGLLTVNALVAGRELLIPIQCEYYALEGLGQLLKNIDLVKAHLNPELEVSAILLTMYDARTRLASGVADEVRAHFGDAVLSTVVPRSVRISEAPSYGQTVMTYDPGSPGALSYLEAAREIATQSPESAGPSH
jgi:chromosome partitioning protein